MSKLQDKINSIQNAMEDLNIDCDVVLLEKILKGLGPSIYNADAAYVSTSNKAEVERLKQNFLIKKLGISPAEDLDMAIQMVVDKMGKSNPRKHRAIFYYLLVKHFKKEAIYR